MGTGAACVLIAHASQSALVGVLAICLWAIGALFVIWAIKEFIRPSKWRRRPPWLAELERRTRS